MQKLHDLIWKIRDQEEASVYPTPRMVFKASVLPT